MEFGYNVVLLSSSIIYLVLIHIRLPLVCDKNLAFLEPSGAFIRKPYMVCGKVCTMTRKSALPRLTMGFEECFVAAALALLFLIHGRFLNAAPPAPVPMSAGVLGYAQIEDPRRIAKDLPDLAMAAGVPMDAGAVRKLLSSALGDRSFRLPRTSKPASFFWLKSGAGESSLVAILPEVPNDAYLERAARSRQWTAASMDGLTAMGSASALEAARTDSSEIQRLHEAVYPAPVVFFFRGTRASALVEYLAGMLDAHESRTVATDLFQGKIAAGTPGAGATGIASRVLAQIAGEIDLAHMLLDYDAKGLRLTANLTARAGTPLAALLQKPPDGPNPLVRYLPSRGWFHACVAFGDGRFQEFLKAEAALVAKDRRLAAGGIAAVQRAAENTPFSGGWLGVSLLGQPLSKTPFVAIHSAVDAQESLVWTEALFAGSAAPDAAREAGTPMAKVEGFEIFGISKGDTASKGQSPWLTAFAGPYQLIGDSRADLEEMLRRALRMRPLREPFLAQDRLISGAQGYADFRFGLSARPVDWGYAILRIGGDSRAQVAVHVPWPAVAALIAAKE